VNGNAYGKYQFIWSEWGNKIKSFSGNPNLTPQQFLKNHVLQDSFYNEWYAPNVLESEAKNIITKYKVDPSQKSMIEKLVHFRGGPQTEFYLQKLKESNGNASYAQQQLDLKYPSNKNATVEYYIK